MSRLLRLAAAALTALCASPAAAHETLHTVRRGEAIAVRAYFADGEALAYAAYEVFSPADPTIPHQKGRTDRNGWLAFVPDAPGTWRVRVVEEAGHGLDLRIDAGAAVLAGGAPASSAAFVLRPLAGLVAVGAVFAALYFTYRRRGTAP